MGLLSAGVWLAATALLAWPQGLKEGDLAPDFTLPDQDEVNHTLSDYRGQKLLVYFYPKDDTPGCTKEACGLRDAYADYEAANIAILGISYDTPGSHRKFREKHNLPFTLLSDSKKVVAELYGTRGIYPLAIRRSFLINEEGYIVKIIKDVDVTTHSQDVLQHFRESAPQP
ncbi:MAG: peroxiredoxin [Fidelibacterota bacterium]|nr:MAG: peroxiredoxin [Candidatus Neomarinimicrobiota bacterium]